MRTTIQFIIKGTAVIGLVLAAVGTARGAHASIGSGRAPTAAGVWAKAQELPGTAVLNAGGSANLGTVSCASEGNCGAGGSYKDGSGHTQAFVASQIRGAWHKAIEVPGTAALNAGGNADVASVSCSSPGSCAAGGAYTDGSGHLQPFVVGKTNGTWHTAILVPGAAALNAGGNGSIMSVSCASAGNCSAGGYYRNGSGGFQAFVVNQVNGTWRKAIIVPGTATLNAGVNDSIISVFCASAGNCAAGGYYRDVSGGFRAFAVDQVHGFWHKAIEAPGTATLNTGGNASIGPLSCASAGNCSAGGYYTDASDNSHPFVLSEVAGTWRKAIEVPGTDALNKGGHANLSAISCGSAANCSAGGYYTDGSGHAQPFVVTEVNGTWRKAIKAPGTATLNSGGFGYFDSLSCPSAGNCSGGGSYTDASGHGQAFVIREVNGTWRTAIEVPGTVTLNKSDAAVTKISCTSPGECSAAGHYTDSSGHQQVFVVTES